MVILKFLMTWSFEFPTLFSITTKVTVRASTDLKLTSLYPVRLGGGGFDDKMLTTVQFASFCDDLESPRVWGFVNPVVFPLPTTTCVKLKFFEDIHGTHFSGFP